MKIFCICVAKDEADVIGDTLRSAARWADRVFVLENGGEDDTWEVTRQVASELENVTPVRRELGPFRNSLRAEVFNEFRALSSPGDWWCRLDADEIYIDDPRVILATIEPPFNRVWGASYTYYFTDRDLERYTEDPTRYAREVPVEQRLRYYLNDWSELRFVRDEKKLVWQGGWPRRNAIVSRRRIRLKHFQFRSPAQIERRLVTRLAAFANVGAFRHESTAGWVGAVTGRVPWEKRTVEAPGTQVPSWRDRVVPAAALHYDALDGHLEPGEDLMPVLPRVPTRLERWCEPILHRVRVRSEVWRSRGRSTTPASP